MLFGVMLDHRLRLSAGCEEPCCVVQGERRYRRGGQIARRLAACGAKMSTPESLGESQSLASDWVESLR